MNVVVLVAVLVVAVVVVVCHRRIHSRESQTQCAYRRKDSSRLHEKNEGAPIWRGLGFYTGDYKAYRKVLLWGSIQVTMQLTIWGSLDHG